MMDDPNWETKIGANVLRDLFATIDFSGFTFGFGGRSWNLNEFTYSFPLQRASGPIDLSGIDLRGIKLRHCRFVNINFAGASFDNAQLSEIELVGSSLYRASFRGSRFQSVRCGKGSSMNGIDLTSAFVNAIFLNDKCMSTAFIYKDVSYWYLIKSTWKSLIGKPTKTEEKVNHTQFVWVVTNEMNLRETRQIKEYLIWYQDTMERIKELRKEPLYQRLAFMLSLVATKRWSSYRVLALFAFVVDLVYSLIFWITKAQFVEMPKNLVSIFYASTLIFTSLGVEGVKPGTSIAEILVVSEAIMGYLVLGLFVFLMTRMVDRQF